MRYIPQEVIDDVLHYNTHGHTENEMLRLLREHHEHLSLKTMRRIIDEKTNNVSDRRTDI